MIKAIVFDLDGTIVDTETTIYEAWRTVYQEFGTDLPLADWAPTIGSNERIFDPCADLARRSGRPVDCDAVTERARAENRRRRAGLDTLPGVRELIVAAQAQGLALAVASSSPREWVEGYLAALGLRQAFACVRTADDVARTKPDPALFRSAVDGLGVAPAEALAIEDSPNGALAAQLAGLHCVVVPGPLTRDLPFVPVALRLESLADLDLPALLRQLA